MHNKRQHSDRGLPPLLRRSAATNRPMGSDVIPMTKTLVLISACVLVACSDPPYVASDLSKAISEELKESEYRSIDFARLAGDKWSQVCFFGPYNERSSETLGFDWNVGDYTDVLHSDGHSVIVFATEDGVLEYVIHSRGQGDFSELSGECFPRGEAGFVRDPDSWKWRKAASSKAYQSMHRIPKPPLRYGLCTADVSIKGI